MAAEVYDAVVVGAGAAGGWVAKELCEEGLSVLLLDAGPQLDPERDFPVQAAPEQRLVSRLGGLRRQPVQMRCAAFSGRTRRFFVDDRESPYTTPASAPFNWFRGRQVGGRLHVWARVVPRLSDRELETWPLAYAELAPWYDRVEAFLGVEDIAPNAAEERFKTAIEETFPERRVLRPRVARHEPERQPATIRAAERTGRLTLRPDTVVRTVALDPRTGKATGVSYVDREGRRAGAAQGRVVVLCASTIETLRLLLNSGFGNSSGLLGRGLMDHVLTGLGGPLREAASEPDQSADPYDFGRVTGFQVPGFPGGWALQGAIGRGTPTWYFLAHGEMLARPENRVTLAPRKPDAWGVPAAHVSCSPGPEEVALAADQLRTMRELAATAGLEIRTPPSGRRLDALAFRLWKRRLFSRSGAFLAGSAAHEIGRAPLGSDPQTSVLNPFGRCWDAENVFVADGAAFPAGCWQNVTLTIMALAARASDYIARELASGRL
ncbi:MAG: GMC oxidoreductase [Thermoleophilia bacterium]